MELEHAELAEKLDDQLVARRIALAAAYQALPAHGSDAFWEIIEETDLKRAMPLEVLARCLRAAIAQRDDAGRNRIIEVIIRRTQVSNEYGVQHMLTRIQAHPDERKMLMQDLYADLCEHLIRALMDTERRFWEEHFQHCLQFERKHAYQAFMAREGRWSKSRGHAGAAGRIPRQLIESIDQPVVRADAEVWEPGIEDERAQQELSAVEQSDLLHLMLRLPAKLKAVIWLMFWEERTEKEVAQVLGITDRTVRNRLRDALQLLRAGLEAERRTSYG